MRFRINIQYRPPDSPRPYDESQDAEIVFDGSDTALIPNVGDAVIYMYGERNVARKVESRTFSYMSGFQDDTVSSCAVTIVVTDMSDEEILSRIKE